MNEPFAHPDTPAAPSSAAVGRRLIDSRSSFQEALHAAFARAAAEGCRAIWIADEDFADWPLSDTTVLDHLTHWAKSHRRLNLLAQHYNAVTQRHARFVQWRRTWSHIIECRANAEAEPGEIPTLLLAPGLLSVRLFDPIHHRGVMSDESGDALLWRENLDAVLQRSEEAFPASTLGL